MARDVDYLRRQFNEAFAGRSARDMEEQLNAIGVPAARVRKLGEFLDEVESGSLLPLPTRTYQQGDRQVRTPGIGFEYLGRASTEHGWAPSLGEHSAALLGEIKAGSAVVP